MTFFFGWCTHHSIYILWSRRVVWEFVCNISVSPDCVITYFFCIRQDLLVTLSTLLRGSIYERLRWTFKLYDINRDGCIGRNEIGKLIQAVHELMGRRPHQPDDDRKAHEQVTILLNSISSTATTTTTTSLLWQSMVRWYKIPQYLHSGRSCLQQIRQKQWWRHYYWRIPGRVPQR